MSRIQRLAPTYGSPEESMRKVSEAVNAIASELQPKGVRLCSGTVTASIDYGLYLFDCSASAGALYLPSASSYAGVRFVAIKTDSTANALTADGDGSETINGSVTASVTTQYAGLELVSTGSEWIVVP